MTAAEALGQVEIVDGSEGLMGETLDVILPGLLTETLDVMWPEIWADAIAEVDGRRTPT